MGTHRLLLGLTALFTWTLLPSCGDAEPDGQRVLIVGWDGATFDCIDPLLDAGKLPNLAAMIAAGRSGTLASTKIPISSAAWPTMATGKEPGEHGIYSFFRRDQDDSYDVRLVQSTDVGAPPIWRTLSRRNHIVHVWGVPLTYPPEPVQGTLVAGMLSPFDAEYAHPPGLAGELRATGFVPDVGIWQSDAPADLNAIHAQLDRKERELLARIERRDWSFSMVVFKCLDVLCHNPATNLRGPEVTALLVRLDDILGKMRAAAGDDTVTMLVSDHGFTTYRRTLNLHRWLIEKGHSIRDTSAEVAAPARGPLAAFKASERSFRLGQLKLGETRAYAEACEGNYGSIRLNVQGREPNGRVARDDMDDVCAAIERDLRMLEFPAGVPVVRHVLRAKELYPGPVQDAVIPDLIVELAPEFRCVAATFGETLAFGHAPFPDHALEGVFAMAGEGVLADPERGALRLIDIAPLALHILGEPLPTSLEGDCHAHFLEDARVVQRIVDADDPSLVDSAEAYRGAATITNTGEVESRIKGSGYAD